MGYGNAVEGIYKETVAWVSDSGGDASVAIPNFHGHVLSSVVMSPGENGDRVTDVPAALYDAVLNDIYGEDIMEGELANASATISKTFYSDPPIPIHSALTLVISNAGSKNQGQIVLLFEGIGR